MDEWVRLLPTYDRVELFRQQLEDFARDLPAEQQRLFTVLIARSLTTRSAMRHQPAASDLQALLSELSPVTFAPRPCH